MAKALTPIGHEDRLSIVDHLDELRSRLVVCLGALIIAFGLCFWQNHALLDVLNRALPHVSSTSAQHGLASLRNRSVQQRQALLKTAAAFQTLAAAPSTPPGARPAYAQAAAGMTQAANELPSTPTTQEKPITIGVGEPFTTTLTVAAYFALLFTLPVLLYQLYAFMIPALNPEERRVAIPVTAAAPMLFLSGLAFAFVIILPPAVHFLQGYNSANFDILVQAKAYYTFEIMTMLLVGLAFQLPLALLALHRIGAIDGTTLTRHWRYAIVIIAVIAAAMPGADPVTTSLEALPLVVLFGVSIVLLKIADRRAAARAAREEEAQPLGLDPT